MRRPNPRLILTLGAIAVLAAAVAASGPAAAAPDTLRTRALALHRASLVIDLHADTALDLQAGRRRLGARSTVGHLDIPRMRDGGLDVQVFAAFVAPQHAPRGYARARALIDAVRREIAANAAHMTLATTAAQLEAAHRRGRLAGVLSIESGDALGGRAEALDDLYRDGVRMLGLAWNTSTALADGVDGRTHGGLSTMGRAVVRRMEALGMIVDVSHLSEKAFWDVMAIARRPVVASHSSAAGVHPHRRNLTDGQLRAIARGGGVVGVNVYPPFLGDPSLARVLQHIDHMVRVMGVDHVGLGADFDGIPQVPSGLEDVSRLPALTEGLLVRGYAPEDIQKILGGNALRLFKQVWTP